MATRKKKGDAAAVSGFSPAELESLATVVELVLDRRQAKAEKAALAAAAQINVRPHTPVRRKASDGGCDLCGQELEHDVHGGKKHVEVGHVDTEIGPHASAFFRIHKDKTLCSAHVCKRDHAVPDTGAEP